LGTLVVGSWVLAPGDPRFGILGVRNTYAANGTVTIIIFDTPNCETPQFVAKSLWSINEGYPAIMLTHSSDRSIFPIGHR
jgi:hypothetical protein